MQQALLCQRCNIGIAQPAFTQANIELSVQEQHSIWLRAQRLDPSLRQAVGQAKGDKLNSLGRVEVRQVASAMPAFWLSHKS